MCILLYFIERKVYSNNKTINTKSIHNIMSNEELKRIVNALFSRAMRYNIDYFCVRDLYDSLLEWSILDIKTRQQIGRLFFNKIKQSSQIEIKYKALDPENSTGATVYKKNNVLVQNEVFEVEKIQFSNNYVDLVVSRLSVFEGFSNQKICENEYDIRTVRVLLDQDNEESDVGFSIVKNFNYISLSPLNEKSYSNRDNCYNLSDIIICKSFASKLDYSYLKNVVNRIYNKNNKNNININKNNSNNNNNNISFMYSALGRKEKGVKLFLGNVLNANLCYIGDSSNNVFVDAGYPYNMSGVSSSRVVNYVKGHVKKNDVAFITHWHFDHYMAFDIGADFSNFSTVYIPLNYIYKSNGRTSGFQINRNSFSFMNKYIGYGNFKYVYRNSILSSTTPLVVRPVLSITKFGYNFDIYNVSITKINSNEGLVVDVHQNKTFDKIKSKVLFTGDLSIKHLNILFDNSYYTDFLIFPHHGSSSVYGKHIKLLLDFNKGVISHGNRYPSVVMKTKKLYPLKIFDETYQPKLKGFEPHNVLKYSL